MTKNTEKPHQPFPKGSAETWLSWLVLKGTATSCAAGACTHSHKTRFLKDFQEEEETSDSGHFRDGANQSSQGCGEGFLPYIPIPGTQGLCKHVAVAAQQVPRRKGQLEAQSLVGIPHLTELAKHQES